MADNSGGNLLWFLAGIGIGAVAGVLYAPRAGEETRNVLRERAVQGRDIVTEKARATREQASDWVDKGRDTLNDQRDRLRTAVETGFQKYRAATIVDEPEDVAPGV